MEKEIGKYNVDDFLIDESFIDWVKGKDPGSQKWNNYLNIYPGQKENFNQAKQIVEQLGQQPNLASRASIEKIKQNIDRSIAENEIRVFPLKVSSEKSVKAKSHFIKIAAAISLLIAASVLFYFQYSSSINPTGIAEAEVEITKDTQKGQKLTIYLHDGTKVKLNYESSLTYPGQFSDTSRIVHLKGEAFFEVVHDPQRPFQVVTEKLTTQVLGTSFNVNAFPENENIEVSLLTGKVAVEITGNAENKGKIEPYLLIPGEAISYHTVTNNLEKYKFNSEQVTAWKDGIIVFKNASKQEVFHRLERWYGLPFNLGDQASEEWNYTGRFDNLSLEEVLTNLSFVKDFEYSLLQDQVLIQFNN